MLVGLALVALQSAPIASENWAIAHPKDGGELRYISPIVGDEDYPPSAKSQDAQGRTMLRMTISLAGQITECVVTASSGNDALDQGSCALYRKKARFQLSGRETPLVVDAPVVWKLE